MVYRFRAPVGVGVKGWRHTMTEEGKRKEIKFYSFLIHVSHHIFICVIGQQSHTAGGIKLPCKENRVPVPEAVSRL